MTTEDDRQLEIEALKAQISADMREQHQLGNLSDTTLTTMAAIIFDVRRAQNAGDIRRLLGEVATDTRLNILMRTLPRNATPISDDDNGWRIRRTTAQTLADRAFGNGQHAQNPKLIEYCKSSIRRPSTPPGVPGKPISTGPSI